MKKAFSLVELLIVVAILGILAAIALPKFQLYTIQTKEAAAKDMLRILRGAIEVYAAEHNGAPPGYLSGNTASRPTELIFWLQLVCSTNSGGQIAMVGTDGFECRPYLSDHAKNTVNGLSTVSMVSNGDSFPEAPPENVGWVYQASTKTIKLALAGTDSEQMSYFDY
ncbi:MAG: type II secretion system protein [Sedimentisphaerales bacterium]|nr:type II secretion system protein [Sedimentisphaerales bacterium]